MAAAPEVEDVVTLMRALLLTLAVAASLVALPAHAALRVLVVSGLGGEPEYEKRFHQQADAVAKAAARSGAPKDNVVVLSGEAAKRDAIERALNALISKAAKEDQVAVVLIGHGTYDGEDYRFNIPGPDLTGGEILSFLNRIPATQQLVVNATSASGSVVESWKRANRIVITATKSGNERNATRFAQYWIDALSSAEADRDKNETVTAAEAYDFAMRRVTDAFKSDASLATEHSRMEGGNPSNFIVARLGNAAVLPDDAALNAMLTEQAGIEQQIDAVKARKASLDSKQYYDELEKVLISLAQLDRRIEERKAVLLGTPTTRNSDEPKKP
jgi:hypothetical protein